MSLAFEQLVGRIIIVFGSKKAFAAAMGVSFNTLCKKLAGDVDWKTSEIVQACELLNIAAADIGVYFFADKVK